MKHIFTSYKLNLVKEKSTMYEVENRISNDKDVEMIARTVLELDKNAEEVLVILALNTKNKVIGTFEVSRGDIQTSIASPREIFKRLILLNAAKFITLHNHPSGDATPSTADIVTSGRLNKAAIIMGLEQIDFCILGDNDIYSFKAHDISNTD